MACLTGCCSVALASLEGYEWIQTTLGADPTLQAALGGAPPRIFQRNAPEGIPGYPLVLIRFVSGIPLMVLGAQDVWTDALFDVLVVDKSNSTGSMKPIANRVDQVLNRKYGTTSGGTVFFCAKAEMSEIATTDPPSPGGGARVQNLGRTWRLTVKAG